MNEDRSGLIMAIIIILVIVIGFSGIVVKHKDVLVKEDTEYLYYKEYEWFNLDSAVYKYHKPIIYHGKVIDKYTTSHYVGVPGKGGHYDKNYKVVIQYNDKTVTENRGSSFYDYMTKGSDVEVIEKFYPCYEVIYRRIK